MKVIPVIDLKGRQVVAARGGDRAGYLPIQTPLSPSSDPLDVVGGLLALFPFDTLYIADLDGIVDRGPDLATVARLHSAFPGLRLMVDNGAREAAAVGALFGIGGIVPVIGSETLARACDLATLIALSPTHVALSLDFAGDHFLGPGAVLGDVAAWPQTVIVMTLARVGADQGPDLGRLGEIVDRAGARAVIAAGGVRGAADVTALARAGAAGVLVASALHSGKLKAGDLGTVAGLRDRSF